MLNERACGFGGSETFTGQNLVEKNDFAVVCVFKKFTHPAIGQARHR
jgi:hypothetical protein